MTITTGAGICADCTPSCAVSLYIAECHSSPTPKARGSNPPGRSRQHPFGRCLFLFCMRFYGVLRGRIRTARARRLTSRRAKKPLRGFFRARLGESPRPQQAAPILGAAFFILYEILRGAARGDSNSCKGDRRLRRSGKASGCPTVKIAFSAIIYSGSPFAGASVVAAARQGRGRRGQAPPKGRRPMRAPQPVQCPPSYVPAGKKAPADYF